MTTVNPKYFSRQRILPLFSIHQEVRYIVVIPVLADKLIFNTLQSLTETNFAELNQVGVIVVVNHSEDADISEKQENLELFSKLQSRKFPFHIYPILKENINRRIAGVGYARKIGMDQAALFFFHTENPQGIIISLDADTLVSKNYFTEIQHFFKTHQAVGANICFEHPVTGTDYPDRIYQAISLYELHLRYFVEALKFIQFPYAFQTVGSAFAVRASNYVAAQGMSLRQGGEDFYFLNKLFYQGYFGEIKTTTVFPSPRPTNKTPFGTGVAVKKILETPEFQFLTYNLDAFRVIKTLIDKKDLLWQYDAALFLKNEISNSALRSFLQKRTFCETMEKLKHNASSLHYFRKSFFGWFDMFAIIKFLNDTAQSGIFPKKSIITQANKLVSKDFSLQKLLKYYKEIQRN